MSPLAAIRTNSDLLTEAFEACASAGEGAVAAPRDSVAAARIGLSIIYLLSIRPPLGPLMGWKHAPARTVASGSKKHSPARAARTRLNLRITVQNSRQPA